MNKLSIAVDNAHKLRNNQHHNYAEKSIVNGGGGGDNGGMEARIAVLEQIAKDTKASLDRIEKRFDRIDTRFDKVDARFDRVDDRHERDFRILFGALITVALGLASLMAHAFKWL